MSEGIFDPALPGEDAALPDFVQEQPAQEDQQGEPREILSEGAVPDGNLEAPKVEEPPQEDPLYPSRPRDPETGRFVKSEEAPEEAPQEAPEPRVWAGKYKDADALEKGYRELRDLQRRTAERSKAYEQRAMEIEFQARQMEDAVRRATEQVRQIQEQERQRLAQVPPQILYDEYGNPIPVPVQQPQPQWTPEQVQPYVESLVEQRLAAQARAMQANMIKQQDYDRAANAQATFFQRHPEVEKDSQTDEDIASTILALNDAWASLDGSKVDIRSDEVLDIAYEASQRPALRAVLEKNPAYIDDENGMIQARALASQIDGQTQVPSQPTRMTPRENTPVLERGSSPAPAQQSPLDEFDQAVAEYRNVNKQRGSAVFFGE